MRFAPPLPSRHVFRTLRVGLSLCGVAGFLLGADAANAQVSFTLTYSSAVATASSEVYFYGTITNNSSSVVYLNGLDIKQLAGTTPASGVFSTDTTPFDTYTNSNPTLASGGSYTGQLFGIQTSSSFNSSSQFYGTATLQGGANDSALSTLGMQNFTVTGSAMPEPDSIALIGAGLATVGGMVARRRRLRG